MHRVNLIAVFNKEENKVLMCKRKKDPYMGLLNFVGGKIEEGEAGIDAAYRELCEETGITKRYIALNHFMDLTYHMHDFHMEVYVGKLKCDVKVCGDENLLLWVDVKENFFNAEKFAGVGNLGHIMAMLKKYKEKKI